MADAPRAPSHVAPYVEALGHDLAVEFLLKFGGSRLYWAQDPKGRSEAEALVGAEKLRALASMRAREVTRVPTARPWLAHSLRRKGLPVNQIARMLHVTDVAVSKYLRQPPDNSSGPPPRDDDDRQLSLF
ncbi:MULTISPECIES: hypothetical protein [Salipiger]|jgi:hypothetical protein|uniref:Helix-turn-helix domain-containing protein n=1 Tax=Salipiger profundus TaxID=1229727 RepID=A0A1U7CZN2_9RHOB|nr:MULTISPECIES: hypothetical protein [Salipiger]ALF02072.1 hypothetical protein vBThpSP1_033 [Thiobacimonas phage vB_ThpS-P1]APX21295.1 hypothetical protein Ga0080559_TMP499 [Salipiger profundus]GGA03458.1 hypothetical protein GCM10011326_13560 [Salipiger profundus]